MGRNWDLTMDNSPLNTENWWLWTCVNGFPIEDVFKWLSEMGDFHLEENRKKIKNGISHIWAIPRWPCDHMAYGSVSGKKHHVSWAFFFGSLQSIGRFWRGSQLALCCDPCDWSLWIFCSVAASMTEVKLEIDMALSENWLPHSIGWLIIILPTKSNFVGISINSQTDPRSSTSWKIPWDPIKSLLFMHQSA